MSHHLPSARSRRAATGRFQPQIQALRAIAVLLVLAYHLQPGRVRGGYVGVDVFFVISGFLMTDHLLRRSAGGMSVAAALHDFYSRRVRRILPAAITTLLVTAVVTFVAVSRVEWHRIFAEIRASALYYENWSLAASSTDYLAGSVTSPVQHFWSLSVEEQFYLGWPILLVGLSALVAARRRTVQLATIAVVLVASLGYSVWATGQDPATAYFNTFTRLWEFAVGGIVAALALVGRARPTIAAAAGWVGLALIAASAYSFSGNTPFPGWRAGVPVIGAALVLASGGASAVWGPHALLRLRPVQYIGDISYSIYLWHFPLIVLYPLIADSPLTLKSRAALFVASLLLGAASKHFVEDPWRTPHEVPREPADRKRRWVRSNVYLLAVALAVPPAVLATIGLVIVRGPEDSARTAFARVERTPPSCYGAEVLNDNKPGCSPSTVTLHTVVPSPLIADVGFANDCQQRSQRDAVITCVRGSTASGALDIGLVGDSHATQWLPALTDLAQRNSWRIHTYLKSGCAFTDSDQVGASCTAWNHSVAAALKAHHYDVVLVSARSVFAGQRTAADFADRAKGLREAWAPLLAAKERVIAIDDVPQPVNSGRGLVPPCVYDNGASACAFGQVDAEKWDIVRAAAGDTGGRVGVVDLDDNICQHETCSVVIGSVLVYIDDSHVTTTFSRSLEIPLARGLSSAGLAAR